LEYLKHKNTLVCFSFIVPKRTQNSYKEYFTDILMANNKNKNTVFISAGKCSCKWTNSYRICEPLLLKAIGEQEKKGDNNNNSYLLLL
jgi:hypothetical protein